MKIYKIASLKTDFIRGSTLFALQFLFVGTILLIEKTIDWYLSALLPLLGFTNIAIAWFLYLRNDHFLDPPNKKRKNVDERALYTTSQKKLNGLAEAPEDNVTRPSYQGTFIISGLLLLITATLLYFIFGTGSTYFL